MYNRIILASLGRETKSSRGNKITKPYIAWKQKNVHIFFFAEECAYIYIYIYIFYNITFDKYHRSIVMMGHEFRYELRLPIMANKSICLELSRFNCMDRQYLTQQSKMCSLWQFIPECFEVAYEAAWIIIYRIVVHSYEQNCNAPHDAFHDACFVKSCATVDQSTDFEWSTGRWNLKD